MSRMGKLVVGLGLVFGCAILLRVQADQPAPRPDGHSATADERRTWVKAEFAADARAQIIGLPNVPTTRWVNLDRADNIYIYKDGKDEEARIEAGSKNYVATDPKQLPLIHRFLERGEIR